MTILSKRLDPFFSLANPFLPAANIKEEKEKFLVQLAVPGLKKEDFKIELKETLMIISVASIFASLKIAPKVKTETTARINAGITVKVISRAGLP